nr:LamG domain-containing protein [Neiella litorisoli]
MLLSFQNSKDTAQIKPEGITGEAIGFGMYLVGQGYHTLRMPLDGKDGRPTLADLKDGQAHHIVATYDVRTGLKAIYINGEIGAWYRYPAGSKMLSGGSGMANIGNSPNTPNSDRESYSGVIDEVAFYDFALPAHMVRQHYQSTQQQANYFNVTPNQSSLPQALIIPLPAHHRITIDPVTGLVSDVKPASE